MFAKYCVNNIINFDYLQLRTRKNLEAAIKQLSSSFAFSCTTENNKKDQADGSLSVNMPSKKIAFYFILLKLF